MRSIKGLIIIFVAMFVFFTMHCIFHQEIFEVANEEFDFNELAASKEYTVCLLKHTSSTGVCWVIINSNDNGLINKEVALECKYDPRFLKDNQDFLMDHCAEYVVVVDEVSKTEVDGDEVVVLVTDNITINYAPKKSNYRLYDMSAGGLLKSFLGNIFPKHRYSF